MALDLKTQGKLDKALRLLQHAMALAPKHPEILNKYGEYLEHSNSDIINADMMYFQVGPIDPIQSAWLASVEAKMIN